MTEPMMTDEDTEMIPCVLWMGNVRKYIFDKLKCAEYKKN